MSYKTYYLSFMQVKHVKAWQDNKITIILKIIESNTRYEHAPR